MRVRHRASFIVASEWMSPDAMTERLGLAPDQVTTRASVRPDLDLPHAHTWRLLSGVSEDRPVADHIEVLVLRLRHIADRLEALLARDGPRGWILIVRDLTAGEEDPDVLSRGVPEGLERLGGQHPLLGFGLDSRTIAFMNYIHATIEFDEYADGV